jgi:hypothetical protein
MPVAPACGALKKCHRKNTHPQNEDKVMKESNPLEIQFHFIFSNFHFLLFFIRVPTSLPHVPGIEE